MGQAEQADQSVATTIFRQNTWATQKLLDFCEGLTAEQLATTAPGTYGTIRDILVHVVGAEVGYAHRVNGRWPNTPDLREGFPGFAALREAARWAGEELLQLALTTRADTLVVERWPEERQVEEYPLAALLMQAINHSTEHRTQASTIITQLGLEPPDMSGWEYMVATGAYQQRTEAEPA
jgi:uncharacterized damage-inducible protein DinB